MDIIRNMAGSARTRSILGTVFVFATLACTTTSRARGAGGPSAEVVLVRDGQAQLHVIAGSVPEPVADLRHYLKAMSGADFELHPATNAAHGLFVGLAADFPHLELRDISALGPEGFLLKSGERCLYLIADTPLGLQHAVTTFLQRLGCRWFFPGKTWEVIPRRKTIAGAWGERQKPDFGIQRRIWPGYGLYARNRQEWGEWDRHNRMGGPVPISIGHSWIGLSHEADFDKHPEWFALVNGRRQPTKPCYSHPDVLERASRYAADRAAAGSRMVSMSAPDGLGFCECERCLAILKGAQPYREHGTTWGRLPDGRLVNVTSESLFRLVNEAAAAVTGTLPDALLGCYAYSAYSHPPTFEMHPNVYIQVTTAFRRTHLSLEEQLGGWGDKVKSLGIREYYSVYQWDWDEPYPGRVRPDHLRRDLRLFLANGVTAVNAEASNNWGPRGLGYYVASHLLWDVDTDITALVADFYERAFGPAARAVERYYVRWYGPVAATGGRASDALGMAEKSPDTVSPEELKAAFQDLDEAARLVVGDRACRDRVDALRLYLHYLCLRRRLREAVAGGDRQAILAAIKAETVFGGRLNDTNMIHTRPLIGKAFLRRFRKHKALLSDLSSENSEGCMWRRLGTPPAHEELQRLWADDRILLGAE